MEVDLRGRPKWFVSRSRIVTAWIELMSGLGIKCDLYDWPEMVSLNFLVDCYLRWTSQIDQVVLCTAF